MRAVTHAHRKRRHNNTASQQPFVRNTTACRTKLQTSVQGAHRLHNTKTHDRSHNTCTHQYTVALPHGNSVELALPLLGQ